MLMQDSWIGFESSDWSRSESNLGPSIGCRNVINRGYKDVVDSSSRRFTAEFSVFNPLVGSRRVTCWQSMRELSSPRDRQRGISLANNSAGSNLFDILYPLCEPQKEASHSLLWSLEARMGRGEESTIRGKRSQREEGRRSARGRQ